MSELSCEPYEDEVVFLLRRQENCGRCRVKQDLSLPMQMRKEGPTPMAESCGTLSPSSFDQREENFWKCISFGCGYSGCEKFHV
jgi:hypothetical protein